ncbi:MAG: CCA tRNA nucleotidyltransferase [Epsilonproteobacteria bacterium]|nr:CCA tRNA nucleotidyltransferase [Campylobacterota bacterium]
MKKFEYPNKLNIIFDKLNNYHIKAIIVGGYVRDFFLGLDSKDIDIELYGVDSLQKIEKILQEFGKVNSVGKSFGVCKLLYEEFDLDFSLPRRDTKTAEGHKGFTITLESNMDFKTAAKRRDFTMNAIGYDVMTQEILDPYNGIHDLQNRFLQAVDLKTFGEDPLRILRAVTFAARFDLEIEKELFYLCKSMIEAGALTELPRERIFEELKKMLLLTQKPSKVFLLLQELSAFSFFTEFNTLSKREFTSLLQALDAAPKELVLLLAILITPLTTKQSYTLLEKITRNKKLTQAVITLKETFFDLDTITNYTAYKLATKISISLFIPYLKALYPKKRAAIETLERKAKELHVYERKLQALISGKDLIAMGLKPSKKFSTLLDELYELQMQEKIHTKEEAKSYLDRLLTLS